MELKIHNPKEIWVMDFNFNFVQLTYTTGHKVGVAKVLPTQNYTINFTLEIINLYIFPQHLE